MIRISKKIEYAILAMKYITERQGKKISAKEMSHNMNISFEFLSKTLQKLMREGLIVSHQGKNGGYELGRDATGISISDIIKALEGKTAIVECFARNDNKTCGRADECDIQRPMAKLQQKIEAILDATTIDEIADNQSK